MKKSFTLAEVLITLGIIGIVAAMTLPTIIAERQKTETVVSLKKMYSVINNAVAMAVKDYGDMNDWDVNFIDNSVFWDENTRINFLEKYFVPYLQVSEVCSKQKNNMKACWKNSSNANGEFHNIQGTQAFLLIAIIVLKDGSSFGVTSTGGNTYLVADINGFKKPNRLGYDQFAFELVPRRNAVEFNNYKKSRADLINPAKFDANGGSCVNGSLRYDGIACGALIQKDGWAINKDYPW